VPFSFVESVYFSLPDDKRLEALQRIFAECEKDPNVISLVSNLIQYFKWCLDVRNKLAHAESYPISFFGKKPGYWHLTKRISKKNPDRGYMQIELSSLRDMADKVAYGTKFNFISNVPGRFSENADAVPMKFGLRLGAHIVIYERRIPCQFPCTPCPFPSLSSTSTASMLS